MAQIKKRKMTACNVDSLSDAPMTKKVRFLAHSKSEENMYNIDENANALTNEAIEKELKNDSEDEFIDIISIDPPINESFYKQIEVNSTRLESTKESYIIIRNNSISDDEEIDVVNFVEETNETLNIHKKQSHAKEETFTKDEAHSISIADSDTKSAGKPKIDAINNFKTDDSMTKPRRRSKKILSKSLPVPKSKKRNAESKFAVKEDGLHKIENSKSLTRKMKNKKKVCNSDCLADKENIFSDKDCADNHIDKQTDEYRIMRNVWVLLDRNSVDDHFKKTRVSSMTKTKNDTYSNDYSVVRKFVLRKMKDYVLNSVNTTDMRIKEESDINQQSINSDSIKSYKTGIEGQCNVKIDKKEQNKVEDPKAPDDSMLDTNLTNDRTVFIKKEFNDTKDNVSKKKGRQSNLFNYFEINSDISWQCDECGYKTAKGKGKLRQHIAIEHPREINRTITQGTINCSQCDKNYLNRNSYRAHLKYCGKLRSLQCKFCSYRTNIRCNMTRHLHDYHIKMGYSFSIEQVMKDISNEAQAYKVKQLEAILEAKENELYDVSGKMNSYCAKCNKICERTFLGGKVVENCQECSTRLSWNCLKCGKVYSSYENLWIHVIKYCEPLPIFKCNHCDYIWLFNRTMRTIVDKGNDVECPKCNEHYKILNGIKSLMAQLM